MVTKSSYYALLNAIPMPVFIVDGDLIVTNTNHSAREVFSFAGGQARNNRWGRTAQCVNSFDNDLGCGHGEKCGQCPIRATVAQCLNGSPALHKKVIISLQSKDSVTEHELLITMNQIVMANNLYALFIVENVTRLVLGKETIPMCMHCKKVRDDDKYWSKLEDYFDHNLHVKFSHCICESCLFEHYPDIATRKMVGS
jgi:hypothetical protein